MDYETRFNTNYEQLECLLTLLAQHKNDGILSGKMAQQVGLVSCDLLGELNTAFQQSIVESNESPKLVSG